MSEQQDGSEGRRQAVRTPMISGASFTTAGDTVRRCVVVDISDRGVRLHLVDDTEAPEQVVLYLPGRRVRPARRRWQRGTQAGFEFADSACPSETASPETPA